MTDEERITALEDRVLILEACLREIEVKLKLRRRKVKPLPPPPPAPAQPRTKPVRSGTPTGTVQRSSRTS